MFHIEAMGFICWVFGWGGGWWFFCCFLVFFCFFYLPGCKQFQQTPNAPGEQQHWTWSVIVGSAYTKSRRKHRDMRDLAPLQTSLKTSIQPFHLFHPEVRGPIPASQGWRGQKNSRSQSAQRCCRTISPTAAANILHKVIRHVHFQKWRVNTNTASTSPWITLWLQNAVKINEKSVQSWREWKKQKEKS